MNICVNIWKKISVYALAAALTLSAAGTAAAQTQSAQVLSFRTHGIPVPAAQTPGTPTASTRTQATSTASAQTPVARHGALHVDGAHLTDHSGQPFQLRGLSTHGLAWFPQYVSRETFLTLRDDWNSNCVRLALYTEEYGGYCSGGNQAELKALVKKGIDAATELGLYVIVDWHILSDQDPNRHKAEAIEFFREISSTYKDRENVLYEICNEPNSSATWDSIRAYAREVIPVIRANDSDAVIIVGTPTWSQDIDQAAAAPLEYDNLLYSLHFYAATHTDWLRARLEKAADAGLPVLVSEFGTCDASGNGANDFGQAEAWLKLLDQRQIGYCCWNLANKAESSSLISPSCSKISGWTPEELSESGRWIRDYYRSRP